MSVYVDGLRAHGWVLAGRTVESCHMFIDPIEDLEPLHRFAEGIGLKREWFQHDSGRLPHYDLTAGKRNAALRHGAITRTRDELVEVMRQWRIKEEKDAALGRYADFVMRTGKLDMEEGGE